MLATRDLEKKAEEVAQLMGIISNARRLLILCKLADAGEMNVSRLVDEVGLSRPRSRSISPSCAPAASLRPARRG